ncbi:hypothetical protein IWX81_000906 [Salinibacterium sp. CAN_S4]|uniref:hypothetical protein n=1 Tax=Salinibacterium sp. CAN_S4 TaxID=2787727 RepID=UPI0018F01DA4
MPGDSEFFPPVQYLPWWGIIGFVLLVLVAGWYVFLFVSTRASRVPAPESADYVSGPLRTAETVRTEYLELIDLTRREHASGRVDSREAHHRLSQILRSYVAEREGQQTMQMTLKDLRGTRFTPLAQAVEKLYPGAFGVRAGVSVDRAVDEAKRLVSTWH